jgi:hypothetical protein
MKPIKAKSKKHVSVEGWAIKLCGEIAWVGLHDPRFSGMEKPCTCKACTKRFGREVIRVTIEPMKGEGK